MESGIDIGQLDFGSPGHERRFRALRAWLAKRAGGGSWTHRPPVLLGNFVSERWCRGHDARQCGGASHDRRGEATYELAVLHYPRDWPRVFGLVVTGEDTPSSGSYGIHFHLVEDGRSIVADGFSVRFVPLSKGGVRCPISLGGVVAYFDPQREFAALDPEGTVRDALASIRAPGGPGAERRRLRSAPESLRKTALARIDSLLEQIEKVVSDRRVRRVFYGPYEGDGIPPQKSFREPTDAEREGLLTRTREELSALRTSIETHFVDLHAQLAGILPGEGLLDRAPDDVRDWRVDVAVGADTPVDLARHIVERPFLTGAAAGLCPGWFSWLCRLAQLERTRSRWIEFAVKASSRLLPEYERGFPGDGRPRRALDRALELVRSEIPPEAEDRRLLGQLTRVQCGRGVAGQARKAVEWTLKGAFVSRSDFAPQAPDSSILWDRRLERDERDWLLCAFMALTEAAHGLAMAHRREQRMVLPKWRVANDQGKTRVQEAIAEVLTDHLLD